MQDAYFQYSTSLASTSAYNKICFKHVLGNDHANNKSFAYRLGLVRFWMYKLSYFSPVKSPSVPSSNKLGSNLNDTITLRNAITFSRKIWGYPDIT